MRFNKTGFTILALIAVGLLVFLIFFSKTTANFANGYTQSIRTGIYSKLSSVGTFISGLKKTKNLTEENIKLKEENLALLAQLASGQELKEQNDFLRESLGLDLISGLELHDAGAFNLQFTPEGHQLLINKGFRDGIKKDDVVISPSGILIGIVEEVFENYSRVATITNSNFKATIGILFKNISGIAQGAMMDGLSLDFISQNDEISEGDVVVTGGNDIFPAGLIIGEVTEVDSGSGNLFKQVKVHPTMRDLNISRVLVITN